MDIAEFQARVLFEKSNGRPRVNMLEEWRRPSSVSLQNGVLIWDDSKSGVEVPVREKNGAIRALYEFVGLVNLVDQSKDASDETILEFAKKWGTLALCQHGIPYSHAESRRELWRYDCAPNGHEKTDQWRLFARSFLCALEIAHQLNQNEPARTHEFVKLFNSAEVSADVLEESIGIGVPKTTRLELQKAVLCFGVSRLVAACGLRPYLNWSEEGFVQSYAPEYLPGALALALFHVVTLREMYRCAGCNIVLFDNDRERSPKKGQNNYCTRCKRQGIHWKNQKRRLREQARIEKQSPAKPVTQKRGHEGKTGSKARSKQRRLDLPSEGRAMGGGSESSKRGGKAKAKAHLRKNPKRG